MSSLAINDEKPGFTSILSILQKCSSSKEQTLLRVTVDEDGEFDIIQYGTVNLVQNLIFCIRSPDNPKELRRIEEGDLVDGSVTGTIDRLCEFFDGE